MNIQQNIASYLNQLT